ncbi:phage major capsid protein, P2 family [Kiloniella laminariae]|uniref:Phage major capsid protein, P2 family n=1 Tax=Kiloniella laminariae TaxID=454162 RepID=A0ABT4LMZ8_9PROT|nr:phage major capsid protein, P2 family [Kiloniella laminariae]MCZ4281716.1 phage major capsid protein, P2 family [Kiloniella laminariae]
MKNESRVIFDAYTQQIAQINGVTDPTRQFAVNPTIEQKLENRIQESSDFLKSINIVPVDEIKGEKLRLGTSGPIASRTNTSSSDRTPRDIHELEDDGYECFKTDFDSYIKYSTVDLWAKFPDFQERMRNQVIEQIARDRMMIGFNGTSHATDTDLATNPLLQDVNIGWIQEMRVKAPARVLNNVKVGDIGGNDYKNIDAAVYDIVGSLIDPWFREGTDLVVICGRDLLHDKYLSLVDNNPAPTERNALQTLLANKQLGGKRTMTVPFFPAKSVMVTPLNNLSIYYQEGSRRRTITDNAKRDRIEDYQSVNEDYVIEELGACCIIDGIQTPNATNDGWI